MAEKLSSLGIAALALLAEREMHPYEMYQLLVTRGEDRLLKVRPGSLYHTIERLNRTGLVRVVGTEREGNRPERTTYEITEQGQLALGERVTEMLEAPADEFPQFPLALAEAHNLPRDTVVHLLERRLVHLRGDLDFYRSAFTAVRDKKVPRKFWLDVTYRNHLLEADISWIEQLITEITSGSLEW